MGNESIKEVASKIEIQFLYTAISLVIKFIPIIKLFVNTVVFI